MKRHNHFPEFVILASGFVFFETLLLSLFNAFNQFYVLFLNYLVILVFGYLFRNRIKRQISLIPNLVRHHWLILVLLLLIFIQALFSAPNTVDSMVYHLPRVMYWIQESTVFQREIYTSHDYMPPFASYLVAQLYFWTNSDRLLFLAQFIAFVVCIVSGRMILSKYIDNTFRINIGTLIIATIPMGLMQASTAQNDLITSAFLLLATYFSINYWQQRQLRDAIFFIAACSLGFITKPTIGLFVLGPFLLFVLTFFKSKDKIKIFFGGLIIVVFFLLLYFIQNNYLYGGSIGNYKTTDGEVSFTNQKIGIDVLISNIIRNIFLHIPIPILTQQVYSLIYLIHQSIGIGIDDVQTTWPNTQFRVHPLLYPHEDVAGNPISLLICLISGWYLIRNKIENKELKILFWTTLIGFVMFCLLLKWQPWHSRLQLPWFFLITTIGLTIIFPRIKDFRFYGLIGYFSLGLGMLFILFSVLRTFIPYEYVNRLIPVFQSEFAKRPEPFYSTDRQKQYFNAVPYWYVPYSKVMMKLKTIEKNSYVYLDLVDGYEYPFWFLNKSLGINARFKQAGVINSNETLPLIITSATVPEIKAKNSYCEPTVPPKAYVCLFWN